MDFLDEYRVMRDMQQQPLWKNQAPKDGDGRNFEGKQGGRGKGKRIGDPAMRETRSQRGRGGKKQ